MGSDLFLSTNESSNIISQSLAAGGNIGHLTVSHGVGSSAPHPPAFPTKKAGASEGWRHFENKVLVNVSGQSGERMDLRTANEHPAPQTGPSRSTRTGLMTSASPTRPAPLSKNLNQMCNKQETALQQLRNTFYSNNQGSKVPTSRLAASKPSRAAAVGVAALSVEKRQPHHG